jgi:hypothetical protein
MDITSYETTQGFKSRERRSESTSADQGPFTEAP